MPLHDNGAIWEERWGQVKDKLHSQSMHGAGMCGHFRAFSEHRPGCTACWPWIESGLVRGRSTSSASWLSNDLSHQGWVKHDIAVHSCGRGEHSVIAYIVRDNGLHNLSGINVSRYVRLDSSIAQLKRTLMVTLVPSPDSRIQLALYHVYHVRRIRTCASLTLSKLRSRVAIFVFWCRRLLDSLQALDLCDGCLR